MKRVTKLGVLLLVLVTLCGGTLLARKLTTRIDTDAEDTVLLYETESDSLTGLRWTYAGETLELRKGEDGWTCVGVEGFPLSAAAAETLANAVSEIRAEKVIDDPEDLSAYGLEEPLCTVTVLAKSTDSPEETKTVFTIGTTESFDGYSYLSTGDGKVYLTDSELGDSFSCGIYDLVRKEAIPSMSHATALRVESEVQTYELERLENSGVAYSDEYEWFLKDGDGWLTLDSNSAENLIDEVRILGWKSCVSWNAGEAELAEYGLDAPALTAELDYTVENKIATDVTASDGEAIYETVTEEKTYRVEIGDYADSGSCYARLAGSSMVYTIDSSVCDTLMYMSYESLQPSDVIALRQNEIKSVTVTLDSGTYTLKKSSHTFTDEEGNSSTETVWLLNGKETGFGTVLDELLNMTGADYANGEEPKREVELKFRFSRESETHPVTELCFYPYDSTYCLVTVDGSSTVFVARYDVSSLADQLHSLIEEAS